MTEKLNLVSSLSKEDQLLDEDSSYDSDNEVISPPHTNVSRNVSETLGQELCDDYNSTNYRQYLEFSLKLGYSERLVQQALKRLVSPTNNELLAELIKLGATTPGSNACDYGDIKSEIGDENNANEQQFYQAQDYSNSLRPIVIDGSNVAMSHGNKEVFSCRGIAICVDWFQQRGHKDITVFVPKWRKESARPDNPIKDQDILNELEKERILVYTPSRSLTNGKRMVCYDDRYILKLAVENDGIVVSNDNYRDLLQENSDFKKVVEERILMYSFVNDRFMPPDDPLGHKGPTLDNFLKIQPKKIDQQICPYGAKKKCTYGNKCKFYHPERGSQPHKSVAERLSDFANFHLREVNREASKKQQIQGKSLSVPLNNPNTFSSGSSPSSSSSSATSGENFQRKQALCRTSSNVPNSNMQQQQQQHLVPPPNLQLGPQLNSPQQQPYRLAPGQALSASTSPTNNLMTHLHQQQQQQFPKSHSIDSLPREMYHQQKSVSFSNNNLWKQQSPQATNDLLNSQTPQSPLESNDSLNLHKKLQRQLSLLNPYDPRLYPMQQRYQPHMQQAAQNQQDHFLSSPPSHKPLQASHSLNPNQPQHSMYEHQNVMRIASAPNSSNMNWTKNANNQHSISSASEPQINYSIYEQRCRLHYHLSMIFPQKVVEEAMAMLPDETIDPQQICSTIFSLQNRQK